MRSALVDPKVEVQLFNYSSDEPVFGTTLQSYVGYYVHPVRSADISRYLPREPAELGIRFRSTGDDSYAKVTISTLRVYH